MRDNTPPRVRDIPNDIDQVIEINVNDMPPDEDDELEMEEVTLEQLGARLGLDPLESYEYSPSRRRIVRDDALVTFDQHTEPLFACALHMQRKWAATSGEDERVLIWHTETGELLHTMTEHKDSVTEAHFSHDGVYLATADMSGAVIVHKLQDDASAMRKVWEYSMGDMAWVRWHRAAHVLIGGSENGEIYVWRIPSGDCKILPGHGASCQWSDLTNDGKKLFAAYTTSVALKLWDLKTGTVLMQVDRQSPLTHIEGAITVACDIHSPLYMSGSEDGKILFCTNNGPVAAVEANGAVESVAFSPCTEPRMAASGTLHGQIAIWDVEKFSLRTVCEHPEMDDGITRIKWLSNYTLLVATILGNIYGYDVRTGTRIFTLSGHVADVYEFCYDACNRILLTVSEDLTTKIFKVPQLSD